VVAITDDSEEANVTHKYQYDDFGNILQIEEADFNPFRYIGKYGVTYESEELYFTHARYYDPTIGRFLSEDPEWNTNLYIYSNNNPITKIDPLGRTASDPQQYRSSSTDVMSWDIETVGMSYTWVAFFNESITWLLTLGGTSGDFVALLGSAKLAGTLGTVGTLGGYILLGAGAALFGVGVGMFLGDIFSEQITDFEAGIFYDINNDPLHLALTSLISAATIPFGGMYFFIGEEYSHYKDVQNIQLQYNRIRKAKNSYQVRIQPNRKKSK
jgi:RHS repeat-associated protein